MTSKLSGRCGLGFVAAAWVVAGCGTTAPKPLLPTVTFTNPTSGAMLTAASGSVSMGTLTLTVTATVTNAGTPSPATLTVDTSSTTFPASTDAQGHLTFSGVSLTGSAAGTMHTLAINGTDVTSGKPFSASITVTVTLGASSGVCPITISPADGTLYNETGDAGSDRSAAQYVQDESLTTPGMQAKITVTVGAPCVDGMPVSLSIGSAQAATQNLSGGSAVFDLVNLPDTPLAELDHPANWTALSASVGTGSTASSATVHFFADSVTPTATLTAPVNGAVLTGLADVDPNTPGLQIDVTGTTMGLANLLSVYPASSPQTQYDITNGTTSLLNKVGGVSPALLASGAFKAEINLVNGADPIEFVFVTPTGNVAVQTAAVAVTAAAVPVISITNPPAGEIINDGFGVVDAGAIYVPIQMNTTATTGSVVVVCSTVAPLSGASACPGNNPGYLIGQTTANGSATRLATAALGDDGAAASQTLTAYVTDVSQSASGSVSIQVHTLTPVIESIGVQGVYDGGGQFWLNASSSDGGPAHSLVTVVLDSQDAYVLAADGGHATVTLSGNGITASAFASGTPPTAAIPVVLPDGIDYVLTASVTDVWGNPSNPAQTAPLPATVNLAVKTSLPSCALASTVSGQYFNVADNKGVATSSPVNVPVTVTSTNADGPSIVSPGFAIGPTPGTASVSVNGAVAGAAPTTTSPVTVQALSQQGAAAYTGTVTDPAGNPAAVCTGGFSLSVDTVGPTCTVVPQADPVTPAQNAGGLQIYTNTARQVPVQVTCTGLAVGTELTVTVTEGLTQAAPVSAPVGAGGVTNVTVIDGAANGTQTVSVSAVDAAGNSASGSAQIVANFSGCDLTVTSPLLVALSGGGDEAIFNTSSGAFGGGQLTANITLASSCVATSVSFSSTPQGGAPSATQTSTDQSGNVTFNITGLTDGSSGTFTASIAGGISIGTIAYFTKLSNPTLVPSPGYNFEVVAFQDNPLVGLDAGAGVVVANLQASTANAFANFGAAVANLGPVDGNGNIGTAVLTLNFPGVTSTPLTQLIPQGATSVNFNSVALPANSYPAGGTVTLTLTDSAKNSAAPYIWTVVTDVVPPAAPTLSAAMADQRLASVALSWPAVPAGAGSPVLGFEDRYLVSPLGAATINPPNAAQYAAWTSDSSIAGVAGTATSHTVTGLPTLNQYTFELRAIDSVGNRSPLAASPTVLSVAQGVANAWQTKQITGPAGSLGGDFGYSMRHGSFTTSGFKDLAIGTPYYSGSGPGSVYLLYGTGSYTAVGPDYTTLSQLTLGGTASDWFGFTMAVGDFNGDHIDDLAVGSPASQNFVGRVDIFFGSANGLSKTPSVTIYGDASQQGLFGFSVNAVDVNQDGIADLLVGAPNEGATSAGVAYLFLGSSSWPAPPGAPTTGPSSPAPTTVITGNPGDGLGARSGSVALGTSGNFSLAAPGGGTSNGSGTEYFIKASVALANPTLSVNTNPLYPPLSIVGSVCDNNNNYLSGTAAPNFYPAFFGCFGVNAIGNVDFTGSANPDLLVSSAYSGRIWLFTQAELAAGAGAIDFTDVHNDSQGNSSAEGWSMVSADFNQDTHPDVLVGSNDSASSTVWLYLGLGQTPGLTAPPSATLVGPAGGYFGYAVEAATFRGASSGVDFMISDPVTSYVNLYY